LGEQAPAEEVNSFPPRSDARARVLILGSMPGVASLEAVQYYAHPRNAFWRIIESLLGIDHRLAYKDRLQNLIDKRVALWDVLQSCTRPGSLDADIRRASEVPNDFASFLADHPQLHTIFFNGRKAEQVFKSKALPDLLKRDSHLQSRMDGTALLALPSTSPAMASLNFAGKLERWKVVAIAARTPRSC
jgi:double-stranded uracil-DNA glycosylase